MKNLHLFLCESESKTSTDNFNHFFLKVKNTNGYEPGDYVMVETDPFLEKMICDMFIIKEIIKEKDSESNVLTYLMLTKITGVVHAHSQGVTFSLKGIG